MANFRDSQPSASGQPVLPRSPSVSREIEISPRGSSSSFGQKAEPVGRNAWLRPDYTILPPIGSAAPPQTDCSIEDPIIDDDLDLKVNGTLAAISKAADLLALMHQRTMELQQDAEQRVYEARKDTVKVEERLVESEQTVAKLEETIRGRDVSLQMSQARIQELEQQLADSNSRRRIVEAAIRARDEAICVLQLAIDDRLTSSVRKFEGLKAPLFRDFDQNKR